jgi:hypothetical protein
VAAALLAVGVTVALLVIGVAVALLALGVAVALLALGVVLVTNSPPHSLSQLLQETGSKEKQDLPLQ